jgi:hypothetical protein
LETFEGGEVMENKKRIEVAIVVLMVASLVIAIVTTYCGVYYIKPNEGNYGGGGFFFIGVLFLSELLGGAHLWTKRYQVKGLMDLWKKWGTEKDAFTKNLPYLGVVFMAFVAGSHFVTKAVDTWPYDKYQAILGTILFLIGGGVICAKLASLDINPLRNKVVLALAQGMAVLIGGSFCGLCLIGMIDNWQAELTIPLAAWTIFACWSGGLIPLIVGMDMPSQNGKTFYLIGWVLLSVSAVSLWALVDTIRLEEMGVLTVAYCLIGFATLIVGAICILLQWLDNLWAGNY